MKNILIVAVLILFVGVGFLPTITSIVPQESCCPNGWVYDEDNATWSIDFSAVPLNESIVIPLWLNAREPILILSQNYSFPQYYLYETAGIEYRYEAEGSLEISHDNGVTWDLLDVFEGTTPYDCRDYYILTFHYAYKTVLLRFTVEGIGDTYFSEEKGGHWQIWDIDVIGKGKGTPPKSEITYYSYWGYWSPTPVNIKIKAYDYNGGVKEIHYILDRQEYINPGDSCLITVAKNGSHKLSYWAIDKLGNEEIPSSIYFGVDMEPPVISIKKPEPGIYLFGKKIFFSTNDTIYFGGFTIEVEAFDTGCGVYKTAFYLDGNVYAETTEEPYRGYCNLKHRGKGTIKVVATDYNMHVSWDTLDVVYYNFL